MPHSLRTIVSTRHLLAQKPVLAALGRTAVAALRKPSAAATTRTQSTEPSASASVELERPPLPRALIDDYLAHVGAAQGSYRREVPPHLFPQWCFPAFTRVLLPLPYPLLRVVNGGARVEVRALLPDREPLSVRARLASVENDGQRVILRQEAFTGTPSSPDALRIELTAIVPLGKKKTEQGPQKARAEVPPGAHELRRVALGRDAGLEFALLTGDVNPIHWIALWAKLSGFRNVILHGFSSFARCWEAVVSGALDGDEHAITAFEAKLTRPLVLPHEVGFYASGHDVFVGDAEGSPAYLTGRYEEGPRT